MSIGDALKQAGVGFVNGLRTGGIRRPGSGQAAMTPVARQNVYQPERNDVPDKWSNTFLGPGAPMQPMNVITREKEPRTFQYNPQVNMTISPRLAYGLTAFADLKNYAENVPEVAKCIRLLTEELKTFVPRLVTDNNEVVNDQH